MMTVKKYLNRAYWINRIIESNMRELYALKSSSIQGAKFDTGSVSGGQLPDTTQSAVSKIIELEERINSDIDKFVGIKLEIREAIDLCSDLKFQLLLRLRYLEFKRWDEIAATMGYDVRQIYRLHSDALKDLESKMSVNVSKCQ